MNTSKLYPVGRALAGSLFVVSGINKILALKNVAILGAMLVIFDIERQRNPARAGAGLVLRTRAA